MATATPRQKRKQSRCWETRQNSIRVLVSEGRHSWRPFFVGRADSNHGENRHSGLRWKWKDYFVATDCRTHGRARHLSRRHVAAALGKEGCSCFQSTASKGSCLQHWISDGNFALATFDIRLPNATTVIWLESSRLCCAWRAITRVFKPGEAHRIGELFAVLKFIWNFDRVNRPRIEATRVANAPDVPVVRLKSRRDIAAFLSAFREGVD